MQCQPSNDEHKENGDSRSLLVHFVVERQNVARSPVSEVRVELVDLRGGQLPVQRAAREGRVRDTDRYAGTQALSVCTYSKSQRAMVWPRTRAASTIISL